MIACFYWHVWQRLFHLRVRDRLRLFACEIFVIRFGGNTMAFEDLATTYL